MRNYNISDKSIDVTEMLKISIAIGLRAEVFSLLQIIFGSGLI